MVFVTLRCKTGVWPIVIKGPLFRDVFMVHPEFHSLPFGALGLPNWAVQMEDEAEKKCLGGDPGSISW